MITSASPPSEKERSKPYVYQVYGLIIASEIPLPELIPVESTHIDVIIRFGKGWDMPELISRCYRLVEATPEGIFLYWHDIGSFWVRNGCEILVDPIPNLEEETLRLFILGTTLAMLLHQRQETIVLHASAVNVNGRAVGFVGHKGAGKSTMSATLHQLGFPLLSDDVLAISKEADSLVALPGFPHFKLWPDSVASLGRSPDALPKLRPELEKRGFRLQEGFSPVPVPLTHIFVLGQGAELEIRPLSGSEAWQALMPHWYGARFGTTVLRQLGLAAHFQQCVELANTISICSLKRPRDLAAITNIATIVAEYTYSV